MSKEKVNDIEMYYEITDFTEPWEEPDVQGLRLCWIIRFEQAYRPGHFFEVWIDAYTSEVIGGTQCK